MKASKLLGVCRDGQEPSASRGGGVPDLGEERRPPWAATSSSPSPSTRPTGLPPAGRQRVLAAGCSHPWRSGCGRGCTDPLRAPRVGGEGGRQRCAPSITRQVTLLCPPRPVLGPQREADPLAVGVSRRPRSPCHAQPPPRGPHPPALGAEACGRPALLAPR